MCALGQGDAKSHTHGSLLPMKQAPRGGMIGGPAVTEITGRAPVIESKRTRSEPKRYSQEQNLKKRRCNSVTGVASNHEQIPRRGLSEATNSNLALSTKPNKNSVTLVGGVPAYEVDAISGRRETEQGSEEYLVSWEGYDTRTWVPLENLRCPDKLNEFHCRDSLDSPFHIYADTTSPALSASASNVDACSADSLDDVERLKNEIRNARANAICLRNVHAQIPDDSRLVSLDCLQMCTFLSK